MVSKILAHIDACYPLMKKDAGEFANVTVGSMKFQIEYYEAEGLGNVSVMSGGVQLV